MTTKVNESKKLNWIKKAVAKFDGSDESKMALTYDRSIRELEKSKREKESQKVELQNLIKTHENKLTEILIDETEKLNDFKNEYEESFTNIDIKKIQTTDNRNQYIIETFIPNIVAKKNKMLAQEQKIKDVQTSYDDKFDKINISIKEIDESIEVINEFIEKF